MPMGTRWEVWEAFAGQKTLKLNGRLDFKKQGV